MTATTRPIVFLGPTLKHSVAAELCDCEFRAPAGMGDITRTVSKNPAAIILIDGVFEDQPSVWHKEILYALSKGIAVIGASSMGALRAAELSAFGMTGHGAIYNAFADGSLNDDDEVAVVHGPSELNWQALSDAMVDIRDFVAQAVLSDVLSVEDSDRIIDHAKSQYFKCRSIENSLRSALENRRTNTEIETITDWFVERGPRAKERDCRELLSNASTIIEKAKSNLSLRAEFVPTIYLRRLEKFGFSADQIHST